MQFDIRRSLFYSANFLRKIAEQKPLQKPAEYFYYTSHKKHDNKKTLCKRQRVNCRIFLSEKFAQKNQQSNLENKKNSKRKAKSLFKVFKKFRKANPQSPLHPNPHLQFLPYRLSCFQKYREPLLHHHQRKKHHLCHQA